ncbi:MAG: DUF4922 domain-containing protein [Tannerellaceae bacterium]|jgi:hypothetical protein|nr:DUF4922 domain-containing protein [Tannerellaceae bacterium]
MMQNQTETWTNTAEALQLLARQRKVWPALQAGCEALSKVKVKLIRIDGLTVKVQYNPARSVSSCAKTDAQFLRERPCFLCPAHLPPQQEGLPMGQNYLLLCNPYPIFPEHFTIASRTHTPQHIYPCFADLLKTARHLSGLSIFYNGPQSGASAPDHLHFQAVTGLYMPIDEEAELHKTAIWLEKEEGAIYLLGGYLRNGFILESETEQGACSLFFHLYKTLRAHVEGDTEPRMNIFCRYSETKGWVVIIIPRKAHRPRQFYATGSEQILVSPGAADMGGVFVTTREEDFQKITPTLLQDIYAQLAFGNELLSVVSDH